MVSGTCASPFSSAAAAARAPCPQLKGKEEEERGRKFDGTLTWADALKLCIYAALENSPTRRKIPLMFFLPFGVISKCKHLSGMLNSNFFKTRISYTKDRAYSVVLPNLLIERQKLNGGFVFRVI